MGSEHPGVSFFCSCSKALATKANIAVVGENDPHLESKQGCCGYMVCALNPIGFPVPNSRMSN